MAKSRINLSGGGDAGPPTGALSAPPSSGQVSTRSSGVVWAGGVAPWPGSALDLQRQAAAPPEAKATGGGFPRGTVVPNAGGGSGGPIPVTIVAPRPLPVSIEGGGTGKRGGGGTSRTTTPRARIARVTAAGVQAAAGAGMVGTGLAQNQAMPMLAGAAMTASRGLALLGPAGMAAAAGITVTTAAIGAMKAVVDSFVQRGRELSGLNAGLAASSARADVTRIRSDIREADRLGPQMAKLIDNQARAEATFREMLLPIKNFLLRVVNGVLEAGMKALDGVLAGLEAIVAAIEQATRGAVGAELLKEIKEIRKTLQNDPNAEGKDLLSPLLDELDKLAPPAPIALPAPAGPMGIPVVGGVL